MNRVSKIVRFAALVVALAAYAVLAWLFVRRLVYPYDLEWMEGGMLCHALRVVQHQPIYAPPSVDFIPYLYTPLYPALLAALSHVVPGGVGYAMGRGVSVLSYVAATVLGARFAARHGGSRAAAFIAMALPAVAFEATGSWYDLARPDTMWLALVVAALVVLYDAARTVDGQPRRDLRAHLEAAGAGALLVAAFLTKQTASPLILAAGLALLALNWRLVPAFGGTMAILGLPTLWLLDRASDGWFWTYIFKLHQSHEFYAHRGFVETPWTLAKILGPSLLVIPWALARRRTVAVLYATWIALAGIGVACVGFATQWAWINAYIPGVFLPAIAVGMAAGQLVARPGTPRAAVVAGNPPRLRPAVVYLLVGTSLALHPFDPRKDLPTARDRQAGDRLIERLRHAPGDVLIPFHPFYAHLAGKRTYLHRMGVLDIQAAGLAPARGLVEATRQHRWSLVVMDNKIDGNWEPYWPALRQEYQIVDRIYDGPRVVAGAQTVPTYVLTPRPGS